MPSPYFSSSAAMRLLACCQPTPTTTVNTTSLCSTATSTNPRASPGVNAMLELYKMWEPESVPNILTVEGQEPPRDEDRLLVMAVVQQAIDDLTVTIRQRTEHSFEELTVAEEAYLWLFGEDDGQMFTLSWCCDVLDVTPQQVRQRAEHQHPVECWVMAKTVAL